LSAAARRHLVVGRSGIASGARRAGIAGVERRPASGKPGSGSPVLRDAVVRDALEPRDWGVSPLEPLSIKTADFDRVPILDMPMMADTEVLDENGEFEEITIDREQKPEAQAEKRQDEAPILRPSPSPAPRSPVPSELQKIVTLRVCAVGRNALARNAIDGGARIARPGLRALPGLSPQSRRRPQLVLRRKPG
jgi:hypothetical protein